jgi:hypothetical protein
LYLSLGRIGAGGLSLGMRRKPKAEEGYGSEGQKTSQWAGKPAADQGLVEL